MPSLNINSYGVGVGTLSNATSSNKELTINPDWKVVEVFPIGAIYISTTSTNPSTYFGGTWVSFGAGKVLAGLNTDISSTYAESTTYFNSKAGEKSVVLTTSTIPSHNHNVSYDSNVLSSSTDLNRFQGYSSDKASGYKSQSIGSGTAHNNLMPYITAYIWKRTA